MSEPEQAGILLPGWVVWLAGSLLLMAVPGAIKLLIDHRGMHSVIEEQGRVLARIESEVLSARTRLDVVRDTQRDVLKDLEEFARIRAELARVGADLDRIREHLKAVDQRVQGLEWKYNWTPDKKGAAQ